MRVAAVDCGTNSVRLLIADVSDDTLTEVERRMEIVRLGQGVDRTGRLAADALERTFGAMRGYRKLIDQHGAVRTRVVATSATRDAANRDEFAAGVREIFGVDPEVATGSEEAELSFTGATRGLVRLSPETEHPQGPMPPYLVVDIGGGSTEFVLGSAHAEAALSVDIGCVRLTERHLRDAGDPPSEAALEAVAADIEDALDKVTDAVPVERAHTLVGLAGSVTTVAGIALDLPEYDPARIHHARIEAEQIYEVTRRLLAMTHGERAAIPVMHPGRVDVIGVGALILDRIVRRFAFSQVVVSEHDILDGIAWSLI
ncbi:Ppx/GppA phosphatase family protein [Nonomuraea roseoviolacea]|uniref:Exopolyphosphatase/guanosine-5'-triphosphate, 3'-diphosphate pyrophosphatase n=1 Tax=Nonomuraea roseoviolacea subsp. carminata TaxID=160689 RepID=A0ABT1K4G5_9ACTN|nr:Ppx/GppA phosphatase family protein [Nonomuraea roseoviolacea]MCP2348351.1 exopolyphosphatase/guanosine-5'-triphosphate,3'-diphosphate pyrophosphatase [Nonomuraea roseoviolacea subsp. carminata]